MKKTFITLAIIFIAQYVSYAQCCDKTSETKSATKTCCSSDSVATEAAVTTYYFHTTRRCETCIAVEAVSKEAIQEYTKLKVPFTSINIEDESQKALIEKYKASGPTLVIVGNGKTVDLTTVAFMNAGTNPEKLKAKIKETIDSML
ncbi:nitrophenyl compound nitroreductase subunit ArsF family protein [Mangrovibacterium diazotrophicum]|uniref:Thioredoxin domain-containing protein n=1 Tax=Mangrovibacterium diazotrophicum TaxID=1261403 RepID=A0A419W796_9BACT|nr:nitrophenyl compound nitroreductase subunit ArsF family protein [Mangrovibacterium diazotrophicum]RKD91315.1 hypothetical protein BC643_1668 [Mangrovibacterium diazotrophicum]